MIETTKPTLIGNHQSYKIMADIAHPIETQILFKNHHGLQCWKKALVKFCSDSSISWAVLKTDLKSTPKGPLFDHFVDSLHKKVHFFIIISTNLQLLSHCISTELNASGFHSIKNLTNLLNMTSIWTQFDLLIIPNLIKCQLSRI